MGTSQAERPDQRKTVQYCAQDEINQFMSRFLGFVKHDNSLAKKIPKQMKHVGALSADNLKDALDKVELVYHCLDVERLNSIQLGIQIEALNSLHRRSITFDTYNAVSEDLHNFKTSCERYQNQLKNLKILNPITKISQEKISRISRFYGSRKLRTKRTGRPDS